MWTLIHLYFSNCYFSYIHIICKCIKKKFTITCTLSLCLPPERVGRHIVFSLVLVGVGVPKSFRSKTPKLLNQSSPNLVYTSPVPWRVAFCGFQYFGIYIFIGIHGNVLKIEVFIGFRSKTPKLLDQSSPNLVYNSPVPWRGAFWGFQYFGNYIFAGINGNVLKILIFIVSGAKLQNYITNHHKKIGIQLTCTMEGCLFISPLQSKCELMSGRYVCRPSVRLSVCKLSRKRLLLLN